MRFVRRSIVALALAWPGLAPAQDAQTLADIRGELTGLLGQLDGLRSELQATGATTPSAGGNTALQRLDALEAQVQRLTSKAEELEFRINRVVTDGTNRIGDLEFRICEIEPGCDIGALGDTPPLGGVDVEAQVPTPAPSQETGGPALAMSEQTDFDAAQALFDSGDGVGAVAALDRFLATYPGSPLTARAQLLRGRALEQSGELSTAARAYLEAFSGAPDGGTAPEALFRLGATLGALGQVQDACVTLGEVGNRFPGSEYEGQARATMTQLACG
ncbi:tetratricopeptide repeat protein [Wenxinia saemankumensis]|uniref:Cell division coordinator CpoB n=1 Tax=Wenxinia saemankumensis TaxID=1447782 RepID=A0A1M6C008_9RHOB|nr:tetratricopeptide repeat protein [Wenxinia saemankumensis]SHI54201.1 tol-pal system protein YbgF [Wenxinia saemankumensis]